MEAVSKGSPQVSVELQGEFLVSHGYRARNWQEERTKKRKRRRWRRRKKMRRKRKEEGG